ncbi:MAG: T9SS type A sorting domain-containing protein [Crocinitomix sp.]|nr:T9SS type A sorting domain-containing protein [Crocinitomix sp.]
MKRINLTLKLLFVVLFTNVSFGQVLYMGGDTCATAVPIAVGDDYFTPDDGPGTDHWYSFIAPCDGDLQISHFGEFESNKRILSGVCGSLTLEVEGTWVNPEVIHPMLGGEHVYIEINDSWDGDAHFDIEFDGCDDIDSALLDIQGIVYYDLNENGIQDPDELGAFLTPIISDPAGVFRVTDGDGHYFSPVTDLDDGEYEIHPVLDDNWQISSDSLVYTIMVDDTYEQRDSLDFGIYPDTLIYELDADLIGNFPRCQDTINYWLNIHNIGTTIASGFVHLELDDSLYYVTADILPDSVVGQHVYWNYEDLFFYEHHLITVQIGTPDGIADTVSSTLIVTIDSADVEMYSSTETLEQVINCAYDPNDKTPKPLGVGEFGYISPETDDIEYLIRFQNTGTDTAFNVVIKDQLDENLDWYSITPLAYSHDMTFEMDIDGEVSFIFDNIMLPDSGANYLGSQGFVKYRIDLKPDLPLETSIFNTAHIYFDLNPAVLTNTSINTLHLDDSSIDELLEKQQVLVYPNPFSEMTTVYFGKDLKNYSIQIVDLLGKQVYYNNALSGNKLEIEAGQFKQGMYILLLVDTELNQTISTAKLMVN